MKKYLCCFISLFFSISVFAEIVPISFSTNDYSFYCECDSGNYYFDDLGSEGILYVKDNMQYEIICENLGSSGGSTSEVYYCEKRGNEYFLICEYGSATSRGKHTVYKLTVVIDNDNPTYDIACYLDAACTEKGFLGKWYNTYVFVGLENIDDKISKVNYETSLLSVIPTNTSVSINRCIKLTEVATINAVVCDNVGNRTEKTVDIKIDCIPPQIKVTNSKNLELIEKTWVKCDSIIISDENEGNNSSKTTFFIAPKNNISEKTEIKDPKNYKIEHNGIYVITAEDEAKNGSLEPFELWIDNTPPVIKNVSIDFTKTNENDSIWDTFQIGFTSSDNDSGIESVTITTITDKSSCSQTLKNEGEPQYSYKIDRNMDIKIKFKITVKDTVENETQYETPEYFVPKAVTIDGIENDANNIKLSFCKGLNKNNYDTIKLQRTFHLPNAEKQKAHIEITTTNFESYFNKSIKDTWQKLTSPFEISSQIEDTETYYDNGILDTGFTHKGISYSGEYTYRNPVNKSVFITEKMPSNNTKVDMPNNESQFYLKIT